MSTSLETVIYTAHTHVTGGRNGTGRSSDGAIDVLLSTPGSNKPGTNPEQLFGIGYSACFIGAIGFAASELKVKLPEGFGVDADVSLGKIATGEYQLAVKLNVRLPGLDEATRRQLVEMAHRTCPYSRMTRGEVEVEIATS
ncbi:MULTISPECIES: organic hydroperoxide resistance protein [unclassified Lysobacter]|uniref:organic hydroperoxide resistance protein n=1 Tax=unclassified Lysobacter TaxID=2635362 RepID=UPI001C23B190|nr:organic hydroperoxide resistance protein [Lysobacter sp. MMG2]MBU8977849.1 organic hydroperoxide resistance protein [Lysobacter sp. MMG2]